MGRLPQARPPHARPPGHFLLSLRDDALAELDRYQGRIPALFGNYLRLTPMTEPAARTAIVQPIARRARSCTSMPRAGGGR